MGATEILRVLRETGEKLTTNEIVERSNSSEPAVKQTMRRLIKDTSENVKFKVLTQKEKEERYGYNIGCKIHIYWVDE